MARRQDISEAIAPFAMLLSVILTVIVVFGGLFVWNNDREAPLRTAQIEIPLPELPAPPGIIPEAKVLASAD